MTHTLVGREVERESDYMQTGEELHEGCEKRVRKHKEIVIICREWEEAFKLSLKRE